MASSSRPEGTRFIFEAGVKLRFCDESIATACVYYHKFYQVMTSKDYNESLVVMATLSLAAKAKEMPVKLSDVVNTCYRCLHRCGPMLEVGDVYWQLKDSVARYELLLLRALRFEIYVSMPHSHLFHYLLALSRWVDPVAWTRCRLPSVSLSLLQDTYHTSLPLSLSPHHLATAVLYLAVLCSRLPIPGNDRSGRKWWEVLCPGSTEAELQEVARQMMAAYHHQHQQSTSEQQSFTPAEDTGRKHGATSRGTGEGGEGMGSEGDKSAMETVKEEKDSNLDPRDIDNRTDQQDVCVTSSGMEQTNHQDTTGLIAGQQAI